MNVMQRNDAEISTTAGKHPSVAVVILNWNGKKYLQQFLSSVLASTYSNKQIIVADNASTDDSISFLEQHYPEVILIKMPSNEGFAGGYNIALQQVTADYYILLNSDIEVTPGWIEPIIGLMESNEKIGACAPKLLAYHDKSKFEYAGACGGWIDSLGYPFCRGRVFDDCETDIGQYDTAVPCFWASGAAFCVKSSAFHRLKGFDTSFFAHQEEIDLCWRLQRNGYLVYVQPASLVYHVGGGTLPKGNSRKTYLNFRNNYKMLFNNLSGAARWRIIAIRMFLDAGSGFRALVMGDAAFFRALIKAMFHFWKWVISGKKYKVPGTHLSWNGQYKGVIVWDYFIRKRRTFFEITKHN